MSKKIDELIEFLGWRILIPGRAEMVETGYAGDLLSLVMAHAPRGSVWITVQRHLNIIAVASLMEIPAILIAHGLEPEAEVRKKAAEEGIWLLGTKEDPFRASGRLFQALRRPTDALDG